MSPKGVFSCFSSKSDKTDKPMLDVTGEPSSQLAPPATKGNRRKRESFSSRLRLALDVLCNSDSLYVDGNGTDPYERPSHSQGPAIPDGNVRTTTTSSTAHTSSLVSSRRLSIAALSAEAIEGLADLTIGRSRSMSKSVTFHYSVTDKGAGKRGVAALLAAREAREKVSTSGVNNQDNDPDSPEHPRSYVARGKASKSILKYAHFSRDESDDPVTTNMAILERKETPHRRSAPQDLPSESNAETSLPKLACPTTAAAASLDGSDVSGDGYNASDMNNVSPSQAKPRRVGFKKPHSHGGRVAGSPPLSAMKHNRTVTMVLPPGHADKDHFDLDMASPRTRDVRILRRMQTPFNSGCNVSPPDAGASTSFADAKSPRTRDVRILNRMQTPVRTRASHSAVAAANSDASYETGAVLAHGGGGASHKLLSEVHSPASGELGGVETGLRSFSGPVLGAALLRLVEGRESDTENGDPELLTEFAVMEREIEEAVALARTGAKLIRASDRSSNPDIASGPCIKGEPSAPVPKSAPRVVSKPPLPWPPMGMGMGMKPMGPSHGLMASRLPPRRQSHWAEDTVLAALLLSQELKRAASRATSRCSEMQTEGPESASASTRTSRASGFTNMSTATAFAAVAMASVLSRSVSIASRNSYAGGNGNSMSAAAGRALVSFATNPLALEPIEGERDSRTSFLSSMAGCEAAAPAPGCYSRPQLTELNVHRHASPTGARKLMRSQGSQLSRFSSVHDDDDSAADDNVEVVRENPVVRRCRAGREVGFLSEGGITPWRGAAAAAVVVTAPHKGATLGSGPPTPTRDSLAQMMQRGMLTPEADSRTSSWVQAVAERAATAAAAAAAQAWADALSEAEGRNVFPLHAAAAPLSKQGHSSKRGYSNMLYRTSEPGEDTSF